MRVHRLNHGRSGCAASASACSSIPTGSLTNGNVGDEAGWRPAWESGMRRSALQAGCNAWLGVWVFAAPTHSANAMAWPTMALLPEHFGSGMCS